VLMVGCSSGAEVSGTSLNDELAAGWERVHVSPIEGATLELWALNADNRCATWVTRLPEETIAFVANDCYPRQTWVEIEERSVCVNSAQIHNAGGAGAATGSGGSEEIFCFSDIDNGPDIALYPREDVRGACLFAENRSSEDQPDTVEFLELEQGRWTVLEAPRSEFDGLVGVGLDGMLVSDQREEIDEVIGSACLEAVQI